MQRRLHVVLNSLVITAVILGLTGMMSANRLAPGSLGDQAIASVNREAGTRAVDPTAARRTADIAVSARQAAIKPLDEPNPKDKARMMARQHMLEAGQTAEAAALAQTGTDRVLVVLVEFNGTDVFTWTKPITPTDYTTGSQWDPLSIANPDEVVLDDSGNPVQGDCSNIITQTKAFTYTGPLHNQIARPLSFADRSGQSIWTPDFSSQWFNGFLFGNGVTFNYTRTDSSLVNLDFTGKSVAKYFSDLSNGTYTVTGDIIGWLAVPHSTWWYGADKCPGNRSGLSSGAGADGGIPNAGNPESLVRDALNAVNAISNTITGFSWANYDKNGDGIIDRLWIVHAGYGEEDGTDLLNRNPTDPNDPNRMAPDPKSFYSEAAVWSHSSSVTPPYSVTQNIAAGPYIVMPENGGIGVFAHEYAHNLGADDLYSYGGGETSAGFWALQADDWTGYPIGFEPPAPDPWHLDNWGWLNPFVITDTTQIYTVTLGQASYFNTNTALGPVYHGVKIQLPEGAVPLAAPVWQGNYYWWGGKADLANARMTTAQPISLPVGSAYTLTFDTAYGAETEWDFLWVQLSTNGGTTWNTLSNADTTCTHDPSWIGDQYGMDGKCGFTGHNASFPSPDTESFNLSAYAGKNVLLRFWYMTDWGTTYEGPFIDNVAVTGKSGVVFSDNAEAGDAKWVYVDPWVRSDGTKGFTHNFYAQWRNTNTNGGYDSALGDSRWRYGPANTGLLVWYNNNAYTDNEIYNYLNDYPGFGPKGRMLVVDSHPDPYREPAIVAAGYNNEAGNIVDRSLMRDAPFTLQPTVDFTMTNTYVPYTTTAFTTQFPGQAAVSTFNDASGYYPGAENVSGGPVGQTSKRWITKQWDASTVVPSQEFYGIKAPGYTDGTRMRYDCSFGGTNNAQTLCYSYATGLGYDGGTGNPADVNGQYGWHIQLIQEGADHTWATVKIWNSAIYKTIGAAPATVTTPGVKTFTYTVSLQNASGLNPALGTVTMTLPSGLNYVSASPAGSTLNGSVLNWTNSPLNAEQWVTFTMIATTTVNVGDAPTSWTVNYDAVDNSGTTTAMDHGSWTTNASLYALNTAVVGPSSQVGTLGNPVAYNLHLTNTGYNTSTYTVTATTNPSAWTTVIGLGPSAQATTASINVGPLAPGASVNLLVFVMIPSTAKRGDQAATTVNITSAGDPSKTTTTALSTKTLFGIYLPVLEK